MINQTKTKKDIITRLFKEGHIDLDEVLVLMQKEIEYIPQQVSPFPTPLSPTIVPNNPWNPFVGGSSPIVTWEVTPNQGFKTYRMGLDPYEPTVAHVNHPNNQNTTQTNGTN